MRPRASNPRFRAEQARGRSHPGHADRYDRGREPSLHFGYRRVLFSCAYGCACVALVASEDRHSRLGSTYACISTKSSKHSIPNDQSSVCVRRGRRKWGEGFNSTFC